MTHPPAGPHTPPPPSGPRKPVKPIDPNSPGGRAAAEALSQVLAEITVAVWQRKAAKTSAGPAGGGGGPVDVAAPARTAA